MRVIITVFVTLLSFSAAAGKCDLPSNFYDKMKGSPDLEFVWKHMNANLKELAAEEIGINLTDNDLIGVRGFMLFIERCNAPKAHSYLNIWRQNTSDPRLKYLEKSMKEEGNIENIGDWSVVEVVKRLEHNLEDCNTYMSPRLLKLLSALMDKKRSCFPAE